MYKKTRNSKTRATGTKNNKPDVYQFSDSEQKLGTFIFYNIKLFALLYDLKKSFYLLIQDGHQYIVEYIF